MGKPNAQYKKKAIKLIFYFSGQTIVDDSLFFKERKSSIIKPEKSPMVMLRSKENSRK